MHIKTNDNQLEAPFDLIMFLTQIRYCNEPQKGILMTWQYQYIIKSIKATLQPISRLNSQTCTKLKLS